MLKLDPQKALIFRVTHINNVRHILSNGIHCRSGTKHDPNFTNIGLPDLIRKRASLKIPIAPGGTLSDYVPFYFTPRSIMLLNIATGHHGVVMRPNSEIVMLVSSLPKLTECGVRYVFTNGHAYMHGTRFFDDLADIGEVDWEILRASDFKGNPDDPGKQGRYQAEALAHRHVPVEALLGVVCYNDTARDLVEREASAAGANVRVEARQRWYF